MAEVEFVRDQFVTKKMSFFFFGERERERERVPNNEGTETERVLEYQKEKLRIRG